MNAGERFRIDRRSLARSFGRASARYEAAAPLQAQVRSELLERLQFFQLEPKVVIDLGCGTGQGAAALRARFRGAQVLAIDLAPAMLGEARRHLRPWRRFTRICADACALPLASECADLVFCNLMIQWCDDLPRLFAEARRVLRPGGLLLFSSFGPGTLQELRSAWADADSRPHVSEFPDMQQLAGALAQAGMAEPVLDRDLQLAHYPDTAAVMQGLRVIGAGNADAARRRTLTGPHRLQRMIEAYERQRTAAGLPVTWELIYGAAFCAATPRSADGETLVPLSALGGRRAGT